MTTVKIDAWVLEKVQEALNHAKRKLNAGNGTAYTGAPLAYLDLALTLLETAQPQPEVTAEDDKNLIASLRRRQIYHGGYDPDEPDKQCIRAAQRIEELIASLGTEVSMHQAWRKRAEEAESAALSAPSVQEVTMDVARRKIWGEIPRLWNDKNIFADAVIEALGEKYPQGIKIKVEK